MPYAKMRKTTRKLFIWLMGRCVDVRLSLLHTYVVLFLCLLRSPTYSKRLSLIFALRFVHVRSTVHRERLSSPVFCLMYLVLVIYTSKY